MRPSGSAKSGASASDLDRLFIAGEEEVGERDERQHEDELQFLAHTPIIERGSLKSTGVGRDPADKPVDRRGAAGTN